MNNFITIEDYDASIHHEILDAITRDDDEILEIVEDRAIQEMTGYLASRYDCDQIFSQAGSTRHPLILMLAMDITMYHLFSINNPQKITQVRVDRYNRAIEWLQEVSRGKINPGGLPLLVQSETVKSNHVQFGSNPKRENHY